MNRLALVIVHQQISAPIELATSKADLQSRASSGRASQPDLTARIAERRWRIIAW